MLTTFEVIIISLLILFSSFTTGVIVYYIIKNKYDKDIEWLFNAICNNKTEVGRLYKIYSEHIYKYHK